MRSASRSRVVPKGFAHLEHYRIARMAFEGSNLSPRRSPFLLPAEHGFQYPEKGYLLIIVVLSTHLLFQAVSPVAQYNSSM